MSQLVKIYAVCKFSYLRLWYSESCNISSLDNMELFCNLSEQDLHSW